MVKFFDFEPREIKRRMAVGRTELVKYREIPTGAVAYLINRVTAQRFLSRRRFFRPVDEDFSWEWGVDFWSVDPSPVADGGQLLGGSLLESDRSYRERRNVGRSLWATAIKAYKQCRIRLA